MIEVNLHPSGGKKRRKRGGGLSDLSIDLPDMGNVRVLESFRSDPWNAAMIASFILVPLVVLAMWLTQRSEAESLQSRLDEALADSARLAELAAVNDSLTERRALIRSRVRVVRQLDQNRYVWPHLLDEISAALPRDAWLDAIQQQAPLPDLQVQVMGIAGTPLIVTDYVRNLERSPYIGDVQIVGTNKEVQDGVSTQSFTLTVSYTPPREDRQGQQTALAAGGGG